MPNRNPCPAPRRRSKRKLERTLEAAAIAHAKLHGVLSRKMNGLGFNAWPDRAFLPPQVSAKLRRANPEATLPLLWVEFKREGEGLTDLQVDMHKDLRKRLQQVHMIDNMPAFKELLDYFVKYWKGRK